MWDALFESATNIARQIDVEPSFPRIVQRQLHRPNINANDARRIGDKKCIFHPLTICRLNKMSVFLIPSAVSSPKETTPTFLRVVSQRNSEMDNNVDKKDYNPK